MSHTLEDNERYCQPEIIKNFMWNLGQKSKNDEGDTKIKAYEKRESLMNRISTNIDAKTHLGREYSNGKRKNIDKRTIPAQMREAI